MDVEVIKLGGNVLKTEKDRLICSKKINFKNNKKKIIVCSAMGRSGFPYSTDNLNVLAKNINELEKDRLLSCGEIISSVVMSSFFNDLLINAYSLSYLDLGIIVEKNEGIIKKIEINEDKIKSYLKKYDVLIVPGFIAKDQNNEIRTLGRGNSDLTAMIIAKMFSLNKVYLFKDVLGVYPFLLSPIKNYNHYDYLHYDDMFELINSGSSIISKDALLFAKNNGIEIEVTSYNSFEKGTVINDKIELKKDVGFFIKDKIFDIVSNYPCLLNEKLNKEFKNNQLIIKKEYIEGNHYYFKLDSSQLLLAKKLIVNKIFDRFIKL